MSKRKEIFKKLACGVLSVSMMAGLTAQSAAYAQSSANSKQDRIEAQVKALEESLDFVIAPDIDTKTSEPVSIIVQFKSKSKIELMNSPSTYSENQVENIVEKSHKEFKSELESMKKTKSISTYKINYEYENTFNGISITLPGNKVEELLKIDEVARIWKNYEITPAVVNPTGEGKQTVDAQEKVSQSDKKDNREEKQSNSNNQEISPLMHDSIPLIGVDKLHEEGVKGEGIKVGVLDTGIDYNHPDLTNAYKGFRKSDGNPKEQDKKETMGWDFVDNDADPMETTYQDWEDSMQPEMSPYGGTYYTSHGTHVSGTIAGQGENDVDYAVTGVAPDVELYGYRVLGPYGSGATDGILAGIEKSVEDGMDVINLSLGADINHPLFPTNIACNNATMAGVVTVIAAGNSGPDIGSVGAPGSAPLPITVGSSTTEYVVPDFDVELADGTVLDASYLAEHMDRGQMALDGETFEMVYVGLGKPQDFKGKNLKDKVALVDRGEISFVDKMANAYAAGAKAVLMINSVDSKLSSVAGMGIHTPGVYVSNSDGKKIMSLMDEGQNTVTFKYTEDVAVTQADKLSEFSSTGPVQLSENIKPEIIAPGQDIFSTYPEYMNDKTDEDRYDIAYSSISGTSMATPHIAGISALILQQNPNYTPADVKVALMNNAENLDGDYAVNQVGAGRVNAYEAVKNDDFAVRVNDIAVSMIEINGMNENNLILVPDTKGSLAYGPIESTKTSPARADLEVELENKTNEKRTYNIEVEYLPAMFGGKDPIKNKVRMSMDSTITVNPKSKRLMYPAITIPNTAEAGYYQGYITLTNTKDSSEKYKLPFSANHTKAKDNPTRVAEFVGTDRYETATKISREIWGYASQKIVLVSGESMVDGLAATPFAKAIDAPILLTQSDKLTPITKNEIMRLNSSEVYVIGGENAISNSVQKELENMGVKVERIAGIDRYETSLKIAKELDELGGDVSEVFMVNGTAEVDALSISPVAAKKNAPIILTNKDNIPAGALDWMNKEKLESGYIIGGKNVLDDSVLNQLNDVTSSDVAKNRLGGETREDTNAKIIREFYKGQNVYSAFVADSKNPIDALAAGAAASKKDGMILLGSDKLTELQEISLEDVTSDWLYKAGGRVSQSVFNEILENIKK